MAKAPTPSEELPMDLPASDPDYRAPETHEERCARETAEFEKLWAQQVEASKRYDAEIAKAGKENI